MPHTLEALAQGYLREHFAELRFSSLRFSSLRFSQHRFSSLMSRLILGRAFRGAFGDSGRLAADMLY
jgi:hypothetical protein